MIKVVGKREKGRTNLRSVDSFLQLVVQLRGKKPFVPKGVYRFSSFEESQQWSLKMMARRVNHDPRP
jgi:hypothetical protein